jgi:hypothetical protein
MKIKATVWTLTVDDNHGTTTTVHGSEQDLMDELRNRFDDNTAEMSDSNLIEHLTEKCGICLWINSHEIDVPQLKPSGVHAWMRPSDILTALNTAVEDINEEANLDANPHGALDALNLMLNYTYDQLFHGVTTLEGCIEHSYDVGYTLDDVIGWIKR